MKKIKRKKNNQFISDWLGKNTTEMKISQTGS